MYNTPLVEAREQMEAHFDDCEECRSLSYNGDTCPEGLRLLAKFRREETLLREEGQP